MKRVMAILRRWRGPLLVIFLTVGLTVPWTFWVLVSAYNRDVSESVQMLARRVGVQLGGTGIGAAPSREIRDAMRAELLSDDRVQAVCVFDLTRAPGQQQIQVVRNANIPLPRSMDDIDGLLSDDPNNLRVKMEWRFDLERLRDELSRSTERQWTTAEIRDQLLQQGVREDMVRGYLYLDLSKAKLRERFWRLNGPALKRVAAMAGVMVLIISAGGILAWIGWQRTSTMRQRAELDREGAVAERGLTAAVLAHEIRNPLGALRFQLHSLKKNSDDSQRVQNTCQLIDAELSRIQQLVQDYLAHERATTIRSGPVELLPAVQTLQTIMAEQLRSTTTELRIEPADRRIVVICDPHGLRQVLMNLIINAQQAMRCGGTITIRTGIDDGFGLIEVVDTGPGIPAEMRDRLFKPFQTSKRDGSGIGLALVKRFADNFGGTVTVDSEHGRGTRFELRLPLAGGGLREAAADAQADTSDSK